MKNVALSILGLILIITSVAHPAEAAAARKYRPLVVHSDRSRDAFASVDQSTAAILPGPYAASEIERARNGAMSAPAGR